MRSKKTLLVVSDGHGNVFEIPGLEMAAMTRNLATLPDDDELIPLPFGSNLFELPGRTPVGYDRESAEFVAVPKYEGQPVFAVAAFMAPAYTQLLRTAYQTHDAAVTLPLFAYTAVGWKDGQFVVAAQRVDDDVRQDLENFNDDDIEKGATATLQRYGGNRLVRHLVENCVRRYHCPAAQNFVLGRWECPVPTSPACNAACIGCISYQPKATGVAATQDRIDFVPTVAEIVEFTVPHLMTAPRAIISFGQGCEGEPLLQGRLIEDAIREIRRRTERGTINLNTNACFPRVVERLCDADLDSIRVSLNSAQETLYNAYYHPRGYGFADVLESLQVMRSHNRWISLNYFIFPGLTDNPAEMAALLEIIRRFRVDTIQMRNLNIDPEWYIAALGLDKLEALPIGIKQWQQQVKKSAPWIRFGYFNPPKEEWGINQTGG
jgi:pyruvate-formate lyase-activating enzyme